jgi:signal transduction histidine kinase
LTGLDPTFRRFPRPLTDPEAGPISGMSKIAADSRNGVGPDQTSGGQTDTPAVLKREKEQLEIRLAATAADLAASRIRMVEAADAERQRIERDLHDSVQQQLVGIRIKLELAAEEVRREPESGERMIQAIGRQMDEVLETLRSLARGIYPAVLHERGLGEALKSAGRRSPAPVSVRVQQIGRPAADVEIAVYFCCLEAIQNVAKHAGREAGAVIRLWEDDGRLAFEVVDSGVGFDTAAVPRRHGLVNMADRIEAVGGTLRISSRAGHGTAVRGTVPLSADGTASHGTISENGGAFHATLGLGAGGS